jgi:hypothetical protein
MELLEEKKPILSDMAAKEKKRWEETVRQLWDFLFESFHEKEQSEFDFMGSALCGWDTGSLWMVSCNSSCL